MRLGVALLASLSACVSVSNNAGQIFVTWELVDDTGAPVGCIEGEEVHIVAASVRYVFPCSAGAGTTGLVAAGDYTVTIELYTNDGAAPQSLARLAHVPRDGTSDLGHIVFTVASSSGSATFTWFLHPYALEAPPVSCAPGESLYFEVSGIEPFSVDCAAYSSQPLADLAPGTYDAYVALEYNGVVEDDPRPGFGNTELSVTFDVQAGADTPVELDFVVQEGPARSERTAVLPSAPKKSGGRPQK